MIPTDLKNQLAALQAAYVKGAPIERAPPLVYADIDNKAWALIAAIDGRVASLAPAIDGFSPGNSALKMAAGMTALASAAQDELDACEMRAYVGRFAANIELIEGYGRYFANPQPLQIVSTIHAVLNFMDPEQTVYVAALLF